MKIIVNFKHGGMWVFDFINEKAFNDYKESNKINILSYEIL